ncbi:MAG: hypothetical protein DRJ05_18965 [Bacteroidetes bacterium]|nr:MAG: hypothetical protein DRJ05_18965 [Bacteroidota bacterium]
MQDFSLINTSFFEDISILYGGSSAINGTGNIGGGIYLENKPEFRKGKKIGFGASAGSFSSGSVYGNLSFSGDKWVSSTRYFLSASANDFPYENMLGQKETRENAAVRAGGVIQDIYGNFNDRTIAGLSLWYQETNREIPNSIVSASSDATQRDKAIRAMASLKHFLGKGQFLIKGGWFHDDLHFIEPNDFEDFSIDSRIKTQKSIAEIQYQRSFFENLEINAGGDFNWMQGNSNNYNGLVEQWQAGLFLSSLYHFTKLQWRMTVNLRQEYSDAYNVPFTPSFGLEGKLWYFIYAKMNLSRNFRVPSINERFFEPYGNPDLEPENSINYEAGFVFDLKEVNPKTNSNISITAFSSEVDNWIIWLPVNNFWSPTNIKEVWARGAEVEFDYGVLIKKLGFDFSTGYSFTRSTSTKKVFENDQSLHKQLVYVPVHKVFGQLYLNYKGFTFGANYIFTGKRYTTSDNIKYLPAYSVWNFTFAKNISFGSNLLKLQLDMDNAGGAEYQLVNNYPMPGRAFKFTVNFMLK